MTDRERILMNIAVDTSGHCWDTMQPLAHGWVLRFSFDRPAPQFIPEEMAEAIAMPLKPGDIVRCKTNPNHPWGIAEFVEPLEYAGYLLRLIGGTKLCRMSNESVDVLRFMNPSRLYGGAKYRIYQWATGKAFRKPYNPDADDWKRCGGVEFDGDTLTIWSRSHIFGMEKRPKDGPPLFAQPVKFTLKWSDKTKLKDIVAAMREQGFAKEFVYLPEKPTEGQAGYISLTPDDVLRGLQSAGCELKEPHP